MRVVIIGAGYAGLACALRLSHQAPRAAEITLINASPLFVERIRLHEQAAGSAPPTFGLATFLRGTRVRLRVGHVEQIDLAARTLRLGPEQLAWDHLVLALGSRVAVNRVPGAGAHAFTLDATSTGWLAQVVPRIAARGGHVAVVGGGLTGIEAAAELAERYPGLRLSLITRGAFARDLPPKARVHLCENLRRAGVSLREHVDVRAVEAGVLQTAEGVIPFDACVWSAGFEAAGSARALALSADASGRIYVDAKLRAEGRPDVYVVGDLIAQREPRGAPLPMGCKSAFPTGLHVADNIARALRNRNQRDYVHRAVFYCVSLGRRDALVLSPSAHTRDARHVFGGRAVARFKELICRGTRWFLTLERQRARLALPAIVAPSRALSEPAVRQVSARTGGAPAGR